METYIRKNQNKVADYIATQTITDLCEAAERKKGARLGMEWWEQTVLDLAEARETASAEVEKDGLEE